MVSNSSRVFALLGNSMALKRRVGRAIAKPTVTLFFPYKNLFQSFAYKIHNIVILNEL